MELPKLDAPTAYDIAEKSAETIQWLRDNVRVGYITERGPAWWSADHGEPLADGTHFNGPVPQHEVDKILGTPLVEAKLYVQLPSGDVIADTGHKAIVREGTDDILYLPSTGYLIHPYLETLDVFIKNITDDDDTSVSSVGLLQRGGVAFLQAVLPETWEVGGYGYQPYITAVTSANGKKKTTLLTGGKAAVCDNTLDMAIAGAVTSAGFKHTKNSVPRVASAREKLGIQLVQVAENVNDMFRDLQQTDVTDREWERFLDVHVPMPEMKSATSPGMAWTLAEKKRGELDTLYTSDAKVAPWNGTAFGVLQAVNTWRTWEGTVRRAQGGRFERNLTNDVFRVNAKEDSVAIRELSRVLAESH